MFDAAAAATASEVASEQVAQEQAEAAVSSAAGADGQTGEQADSQGVLDAIATYNPGESRSEVVFVDPTVPNYRELLSGMDPNIEVIVLDAGQDGVEQMASALAGRSGIDAIHIISHGSVGQLQLGTGTLNAESMSGEYAEELATIQQALSEQADILVYGCDFAEGEAGQVAVNLLADLTGADVQASTDETGHISLGGDWEFEVQTGSIETSLAVGYDAQMSWAGLLGTETVKDTFSSTSYSNNNGTQSWATSWSETDAGGSGASGGDIRVNSSQLRIDTISVGDAISRGVNLSGASSATLSFDYTNSMSSGSSVSVRISTDGGASYQTLSSGIFSNSSHTGSGTASFDISSYMSANTKVQFIVTGISGSGGDRLFVDNVQISYNVNSAPTITNLSGDSLAYSEGAGAVVIEQGANALVADVDSTNLDTGTLTVSIPSGGDSAEDVLSIRNQGTGAGQIGVSGSTVTYGGTTIGTFTGGSSGSNLVITLTSNATPTAVTALVKNITYQNTDTNAPTTGARTVRYVLTDGDGGTSANYDTTVTVSAVNDAPVLADTALTLTVAEDAGAPSGAVGSLVSAFTGGITDVDSGAAKGLAITGSNETTGTWYYTTNGGSTWTAVGTVSNTSALLLADNGSTRLYFAPNADYNGTSSAALTVRAWDQTSGTAGTKVSTASNGGTTAFSSATDTVDVTVTPVDDAPVAADDRAGLTFDGVDDYVDMGSGAVYEVTNTVTMEAWINREPSSQSTQIIINKEGEYEVALDADGSLKWAFANTNPGWAWHDTGVVIPVHTWTHIAVTYDNGTITSYVNGVAVETFAGSGTIGDAHPTKDSLRIGGRENNPANQYFNGQISEAQVWNVARTAGEIASDLNGTLTGSETGLLGYWKFNENTGTTADNLTANSDGTLGGGVPGQTPQWATYRVNEDATLTVSGSGVLGNDYDADGDTLSAIMVTGPSHASAFTLNPDGSFSYTPAANFSGTDSFTYRVSDGTNLSNVATVYIQVDPVNDAPTITNLSGDSLAYNEGDGAVVIEQGTNALVADVDSTNLDTGTLTVSIPSGGDSAEDVLSIRNQGTGAGQIGVSGSNVTYQGTTIGTFTGGSSGSNLVITLNSNATPTAVTALVKNITYQNTDTDAPTTGARTVRYVLTDGDGGTSANYDTTVTVSAVNDAPVLADTALTLTVAEDAGAPSGAVGSLVSAFTGGITDVDSGAAKGLAITGSNETTGTWYYTTNGGSTWTAVGTVSNTSALLLADNGSTRLYFAPGADYNGTSSAALTVRAWDQTSGTAGTKVSTATNGGTTAFSSATDTVDVTVSAVNEAPADLSLSANSVAENAANGTVVGTVSGTDPDSGDTKSYSFTDSAGGRFAINSSTGQITVADGSLLNYESATSHNVTVRVTDSGGLTYDETFTINLTNVNEAPTDLSLSSNTVAENAANGTVVGTITGTDPDSGDTKSYSFTNSAGGRFAINSSTGQITVADGSLLNYEAATNHSVTVRVTDSGGLTYDETFTINLTNVNEAPTGADATVTISEDTSHALTTANFGFSDVDAGDTMSAVRIDSLPTAGSLTLSGVAVTAGQVVSVANITAGNLVFTPAANANGPGYANFTFSVRDSNNTYDAAPNTVTFTVTAVDDATVVTGGTSGTGTEDTPLTGTLTATDVEGVSDGTVFSVSTNAAHGTASIDPGTGLWSYTPTADWHGTDSFTVTITDDAGNASTQVVSVTVTPVGDIVGDSLTTAEDTAISANVLTGTNGATADTFEGTPVLTSVTQGAHGAVTFLADGTVTYTPPANFTGTDSFTYTVTSGGVPETTTVNVTVTAVDDATVVTGGTSGTGTEDTPLTGTLTATDVEGVSDGTVFSVSTNAAHGTASIDPGTGLWSYTPTADWHGTDSFTVTITDDAGNASTQVVSVTVTPVNDAPTELALSSNTVAENATTGTVVGTITGTDPDAGDTKTYSLTDTAGGRFAIDPTTGQLTVADGSLLNYESATSHSVTVRVTDAGGLTYDQTFTINLTNVNEGPTDLSLSVISIAENAATGTVVGTVSSTDPDAGDTKTYSLTDTAGGRFAIDPTTGQLTVADGSLLNYESATSHSVTVRVTDSGGLTYDQTFTINLTNVNEGPTDVQKGNGGGPPFLHSNRPVAFEGSTRPAFLSQMKEDTSEGEGRVPDDVRKPVEWSAQPAPLLDALQPDRNLAGRAHDGDGTNTIGSGQDRASSTSPRTQDETAVNLDAANAARPELEQVPWPPTAETENVPDDSGGLGVPMAVGLVGAVLQGQLGKKERMTTLTGQNQTRDRQPEKEQNSEQPGADDRVVPPNQH